MLAIIYAVLGIQQHHQLITGGYDLGIFEQIARGWSHAEMPTIPIVNGARLAADHFSPILALLGPIYAVAPHAETLLVAQAVLLGIGVIPLMTLARDTVGGLAMAAAAVAYGLSPGIATAAGFDFHEIAFAVPLMAFSVTALARRRDLAGVLWALPLVLVKEDLGLTVAAIGALVWSRGHRSLGLATAAFGLGATALSVLVLIPALAGGHGYLYQQAIGPSGPADLVTTLSASAGLKLLTVVVLLLPTAFCALRSPLLLLVIPTFLWRFSADKETYWSPGFHYDAVLVPIVVAAAIDAWSRIPAGRPRAVTHIAAIACTALLLPVFDLAQLVRPSFWRETPATSAAHRVLAEVPDGSRVAASNHLVPQLTGRTTTFEFGTHGPAAIGWQPNDWRSADWVIVDIHAPGQFEGGNAQAFDDLLAHGFTLVVESHGFRLARRDTTSP
ncbi:MAG: hypothetical protein JWQ70_2248 [Aeromicrobium sp.]|nr:hypothetical protein [Aeromicrobium sp.]